MTEKKHSSQPLLKTSEAAQAGGVSRQTLQYYLMIGLTLSDDSPMSKEFSQKFKVGTSSTVYSSLKRLLKNGYLVKIKDRYEIDDPFFKRWIYGRRKA